ncbi:MAG TPA: putative Ig domain-containing protein [Pedobacter sp.]
MNNLKLLILMLSMVSCTRKPFIAIDYFNQKQPDSLPRIFAPGIISEKGRFEMGITISPNGKSIAFGVAHEEKVEENCIYLLSSSNGKWSKADKRIIPDNINTSFPMFGPDGKELFFAKKINDSENDLWVSTYTNNKAVRPRPLDSPIVSVSREAGHGKSIDGSIYFTSNRDVKHECCGDIFRSQKDRKGNYSSVEKVEELSTDADEESLFFSRLGDYIIIQAWKEEFQSKHDLYISYRRKSGKWTLPKRLDTLINTKAIEQRPFVSPDSKYLFFSRTTVSHEDKQEAYESDIYWVSTKSIFKPFAYNIPSEIEIPKNKPFEVQLPRDLFKDIDNVELSYKVTLADNSDLPKWINFDSHNLVLNGEWKDKEMSSITISATDENGNQSKIKIPVVKK